MGHTLCLICFLAMGTAGCGGFTRLSHYAQEVDRQQNDERLQRRNYLRLKNALCAGLNSTGQDALIKEYGEPVSASNDSGKRTLLYKDGFGFCAEKIYVRLDDSLTVSSYTIVESCTKP